MHLDNASDSFGRDGPEVIEQTHDEPDAQPVDAELPPRLPFPVVGVGASAGGLEAYTEFISHMPADSGMAFVLVQHLSPKHESMIADILGRHTKMPVTQVEEGVAVEPNHVYVIRPGRTLTLKAGRLHLTDSLLAQGHSRPVDDFFRSLATEQRERAIAVILSGMGSNGTAGAQMVKAVGGLCIAQDPDTAKFPSMPRTLIDNGLADFILRPADIPDALLRYARHPYVKDGRSDAPLKSKREQQAMEEILAILRTRTQNDFRGYKWPTVLRRVQRRMGLNQVGSLADYVRTLRQNTSEAGALSDDLLIHVTGFFRDPEVWNRLRERVIEPLVTQREDESTVRCWVTACSSGEEAYTLGMLILEAAEKVNKRFDLKIFATDMAERSLQHARAGVYPGGIESEVSPDRLERFFERENTHYRVKKDLREAIVFAPQNVLQDPPFSRLDIVTCRNLLIYLEPPLQQRILSLLHFGLREGGTLLLGNSETLADSDGLFEAIDKPLRIFRRVGPTRHGQIKFPQPHILTVRVEAERGPLVEPRPILRASVPQATNRLLLEHYTPAAVVVDRQGQVVYFHGKTERFLVQPRGEPTRELLTLARESVRGSLRVVFNRVLESNAPFHFLDGTLETDEGRHRVEISAMPLEGRTGSGYFLVSFNSYPEAAPPARPPTDAADAAQGEWMAGEMQRIRDELQSTVAELQTNNEEMKASHEEVTSINEELQSSNEELETSKEELQSLNEELNTVNSQLQGKMEELERMTNDLTSLLASTDIAVIFLDTQFRIRRFTPAVKSLVDMIAADVGRPISDLAPKFHDPALLDDARAVLEKLIPIEREVAAERNVYLRRVLPYRTADNRIDGVVVTFTDITRRTDAERGLRESEEQYRLMVQGVQDHAIVSVGLDGRIVAWSHGAERVMGFKADEAVGMPFGMFFVPEDRAAGVPELELATATENGRALDVRWHLRRDGTRFWADGSLAALYDADDRPRGFVKILRDATARREAEQALRDNEERLRVVTQTARMGFWDWDVASGRVKWDLNHNLMLGLPAEQRVGTPEQFYQCLHPDDRAEVVSGLKSAIDGTTDFDAEFRALHADGTIRWVSGYGRSFRGGGEGGKGEGESVVRVIGGVLDVTERRLIAEQRDALLADEQAARAEAEAANATKDQFLANASHELRTPLSAILLWSNLLLADNADPAMQREGLVAIEHSAKAQQKLIEDLMDSARFSAGKVKLELEPTDLTAIVGAAVDTMRPASDAKEVALHTDFAPDIGHVRADGDRLQQVVWNLLSNALKFTPAGGRVDVVLSRRGKTVSIVVSDTGVGIEPSLLPEIFARFRQGDPSATRRHGGLGLGLAISRQLVELHGGSISVTSDGVGRGATFTVSLPLPRRAATAATTAAASTKGVEAPIGLAGARVLLVEDDAETRTALTRVLEKAGAAVEAVGHVDDALEAVARQTPAVIVSDIGLPDKDGYAFLRAVRAAESPDGPRIPAVALSAFDRPTGQQKAAESGFDVYLAKPVDPKRLCAVLRDLLAAAAS